MAAHRLPDGSAVAVRMPDLCENQVLTTPHGWTKQQTLNLTTATFWLDRWPRTSFVDAYVTPESLNSEKSKFKNVVAVAHLDMNIKRKNNSDVSEMVSDTITRPAYPREKVRPFRTQDERAEQRLNALREHGNPVVVVPAAQCIYALTATDITSVYNGNRPSSEPLTQSEDGVVALYRHEAFLQVAPEFEKIRPSEFKDTVLSGVPFEFSKPGPWGYATAKNSHAHERRTIGFEWRDGWLDLKENAPGKIRFNLTGCVLDPQSSSPVKGMNLFGRKVKFVPEMGLSAGGSIFIINYETGRAYYTMEQQITHRANR